MFSHIDLTQCGGYVLAILYILCHETALFINLHPDIIKYYGAEIFDHSPLFLL